MAIKTALEDLDSEFVSHGIHLSIRSNAWNVLASLKGLTDVSLDPLRNDDDVCEGCGEHHDDTSEYEAGYFAGSHEDFEGLSIDFDSRQNCIDAYGQLIRLVATKVVGEISIDPDDLTEEQRTSFDQQIADDEIALATLRQRVISNADVAGCKRNRLRRMPVSTSSVTVN
jgi:hypothetical protein